MIQDLQQQKEEEVRKEERHFYFSSSISKPGIWINSLHRIMKASYVDCFLVPSILEHRLFQIFYNALLKLVPRITP